jgi:hypothetical protein
MKLTNSDLTQRSPTDQRASLATVGLYPRCREESGSKRKSSVRQKKKRNQGIHRLASQPYHKYPSVKKNLTLEEKEPHGLTD